MEQGVGEGVGLAHTPVQTPGNLLFTCPLAPGARLVIARSPSLGQQLGEPADIPFQGETGSLAFLPVCAERRSTAAGSAHVPI